MNHRTRRRRLALAAVALLVALSFVVRRTGILPDASPAFDPADYRDVPTVRAQEARALVGQRAVVCGRVVNTNFASTIGGEPTYLNLDRPYPDQPFDAVIWGRDRARFSQPPEIRYRGESVCVMGQVVEHQGVPRIEVREPGQILMR